MSSDRARTHLLFVTREEIFRISLEDESVAPVFKFEPALVQQPSYFSSNIEQSIFVVGSPTDVKMVFLEKDKVALA